MDWLVIISIAASSLGSNALCLYSKEMVDRSVSDNCSPVGDSFLNFFTSRVIAVRRSDAN